ncbi:MULTISPECIES: hypothetical protein [unclassified Paraburkholderia]|uniref:hypothetical protein n=1 Tax=unclassified Paraburkholderia TaxID=2615204 RepID=UPI001981FB6D|nr:MULTISPECIES: hypothetical protein [unclassified Paraburkholderia]MBN3857062.1 hypothetical protein [Paraburkholderia sp. Ac-20340]
MRSGVKLGRVARSAMTVAALACVVFIQGCASTIGTIALGAGLGATATVAGIYCAVACH